MESFCVGNGSAGEDNDCAGSEINTCSEEMTYHFKKGSELINFDSIDSIFRDGLFTDLVICCSGKIFRCHRIVMSAYSSYIKSALSVFEVSNIAGNCNTVMILPEEIKVADIESILQFIYKGEVQVHLNAIESFISSAKSLQIKGLANIEIIFNNTKDENDNNDTFDDINLKFIHNSEPKQSDKVVTDLTEHLLSEEKNIFVNKTNSAENKVETYGKVKNRKKSSKSLSKVNPIRDEMKQRSQNTNNSKKCHKRVESLKSNKRFKCEICDKLYVNKQVLKEHMDYFHSEKTEEIFSCIICKKGYTWKKSLMKHYKDIHQMTSSTQDQIKVDKQTENSTEKNSEEISVLES